MQALSMKFYRSLGTFTEVYKGTDKRYADFVSIFFSPSSSRSLVTKVVNGNLLMGSPTTKKEDYQHNAGIICYIATLHI